MPARKKAATTQQTEGQPAIPDDVQQNPAQPDEVLPENGLPAVPKDVDEKEEQKSEPELAPTDSQTHEDKENRSGFRRTNSRFNMNKEERTETDKDQGALYRPEFGKPATSDQE